MRSDGKLAQDGINSLSALLCVCAAAIYWGHCLRTGFEAVNAVENSIFCRSLCRLDIRVSNQSRAGNI